MSDDTATAPAPSPGGPPPLPAAAAVSVRGVSKRFGKLVALDDVTFDVPANSVFGLLGANGAGKTTLFSIAAGFLKASSGSISVLDIDVARIGDLRGRFSMLPQDARFQGAIPVVDQLVMFARLTGLGPAAAREAAHQALDIVGLADVGQRAARTLSHGMMKRVALCQAFIGQPEVVFLDEPTAGLDPENARKVRDLVRHKSDEHTVVFSSHNLQEVQDICSHICILDHGRVAELGTLADLTRASQVLRIDSNRPLPADTERTLLATEGIAKIERTGALEFNIHLALAEEAMREPTMEAIYRNLLAARIFPNSIRQGASLEARFLEITGGQFDGGSSS